MVWRALRDKSDAVGVASWGGARRARDGAAVARRDVAGRRGAGRGRQQGRQAGNVSRGKPSPRRVDRRGGPTWRVCVAYENGLKGRIISAGKSPGGALGVFPAASPLTRANK